MSYITASYTQLLPRLHIFIIMIIMPTIFITLSLLHLLPGENLVDLVKLIGELLILVLFPCLATILHLHPKLESSLWHCLLLLIVRCPLFFCLKVPPVKTALCLEEYFVEVIRIDGISHKSIQRHGLKSKPPF